MSLKDKIASLEEQARLLAEAKGEDKSEKDDDDSDEDDDMDKVDKSKKVEDEDEMKSEKKDAVKESTKIDLGPLFDGADLTEEFKEQAKTIFEAAVAARASQIREELETELAQRALEESATLKEGLVEKVDGYLDFVVEQWIKNNEIALERGIKAEIFESFVGKMRDVFVEHNINLPDDEFDLVESLQEKTEALEKSLDEAVAVNVDLSKTIKATAKQMKIEEFSEGMTEIDSEKFAMLAEEISFDDEESFAKKLETIRENYVSRKEGKEKKELSEDVTQDSNAPVVLEETKQIDPAMGSYLRALR